MKERYVTGMSHPRWLLTGIFIICALISILSAWVRMNAEAMFVQMEEQIRGTMEPAVLMLAVVFGLVALTALFCLLGLSFQKSCLILAVLSLAAVIGGVAWAYGAITDVRSTLYRPEYLGGENRFGTVWYGILPGGFAVLCFGLAFRRDASRLCLAEAVYWTIVAVGWAVFTIYGRDYKNAWNVFLPFVAAAGCLMGFLRVPFAKILAVLEILLGFWALSGLWFVLRSGGRENAGYMVLPLAAALGAALIRRELRGNIEEPSIP